MTLPLGLALTTGLLLAPASSASDVGAGRPPVALSVSPARVELAAPGSRIIRLRNVGARRVVVDIARKALGPRPPAKAWLTIAPARLVLPPASTAAFTVRVTQRGHAGPGDHHVLVLLTARPLVSTRVAVRMRLGVVVRVRVPGRIVRHLELQGLRVRRHGETRLLLASVANRGNVSEELGGRVTISLRRRGRLLARLPASGRRELRPGTHAVLKSRYAGRVRGAVRAVVTVRVGGANRPITRGYRIRL